ncbi:LLM class flavin-dependent oxidoreductase [Candidatus Bathyarchaeota archaeon]|nr:MAG: LLM class flavin-dependent oxidoreductase [Candidatus Bathyarchaeota archaeon]TMI30631.1 MAG: LLM class flavin-dependent oxidoreductase [Candidatus Bathyarchaeota archaeon]
MKCGFVLPGGDAQTGGDMASAAENAGWDGLFVWEPVWGIDAWVTLAVAAVRTKKIRLGTMISPLSRMRPWKLASEALTLDRLSKGRVIISVGLGSIDTGFKQFGEETDRKTRAELVDESLEIVTGLWHGQPFNYSGKHYRVRETKFMLPPPPVQKPRIPIWIVGAWPKAKSMGRALRYDGILPTIAQSDGSFARPGVEDVRKVAEFVQTKRSVKKRFDIVVEADNTTSALKQASQFAKAGATWWIDSMWSQTDKMFTRKGKSKVLKKIEQGPPRAD